MFNRLRQDWKHFVACRPGTRFMHRYERTRRDRMGPVARIAWIALGIVAILLGIVMLVTPGPGLLAIAFGATCIAQESRPMARACDRAELRLRSVWKRYRRPR